MGIVAVKGGCSVKKAAVGFQIKTAGAENFLGGSFYYTGGGDGAFVTDKELSGSFKYNQGYAGCRLCGNKYVYQCCHCKEFICYDGREIEEAVCPSCGKTAHVPKTIDNRIVMSGVAEGGAEIILTIDVSGSMSGTRIAEMKNAAINDFVRKFKGARMAVVQFGANGKNRECDTTICSASCTPQCVGSAYGNYYCSMATVCNFTTDGNAVVNAINSLKAESGTPSPMPHIISRFGSFINGRGNRYVVVFTDGEWCFPEKALQDAQQIKNSGVKIIAIGCEGADKEFLKKIASPGANIVTTGGSFSSAFAKAVNIIGQK